MDSLEAPLLSAGIASDKTARLRVLNGCCLNCTCQGSRGRCKTRRRLSTPYALPSEDEPRVSCRGPATPAAQLRVAVTTAEAFQQLLYLSMRWWRVLWTKSSQSIRERPCGGPPWPRGILSWPRSCRTEAFPKSSRLHHRLRTPTPPEHSALPDILKAKHKFSSSHESRGLSTQGKAPKCLVCSDEPVRGILDGLVQLHPWHGTETSSTLTLTGNDDDRSLTCFSA